MVTRKHPRSVRDHALAASAAGGLATTTRYQEVPFSLIAGGPFFQLLRRCGLCGEGLELVVRRTVVLTLIAWLPLFVLSGLQGELLGASSHIPFLLDIETQSRLLVALPLLVVAEYVVHRRMQLMEVQFTERHLVPEDAMGRFQRAAASALRLRDSWLAEAVLLMLVFLFGGRLVQAQIGVVAAEWKIAAGGQGLSAAGLWLEFVSLPFLRFLSLRWYFRLFIWARLLWQVSRIELKLVPTHPDGSGGLGFLNLGVTACMPLAVAHGVVLAGVMAQRIFHSGAAFPDFKVEAAAIVALMFCLLAAPMLMFSLQLARTQRQGVADYGALAARYVEEFDGKWLHGLAPAGERLIGTADIQSLADLANSYAIVQKMNILLVTRTTVAWLLLYTLGPPLPLVLTMMPVDDLVRKLLQMLF